MDIDFDKLVNDSISAATNVLGEDIKNTTGFAREQFEDIARSAVRIAENFAAGRLSKDEAEELKDDIPKMVKDTLSTLKGLQLVTIQKVWNAVAEVLQKAVGAAIGF